MKFPCKNCVLWAICKNKFEIECSLIIKFIIEAQLEDDAYKIICFLDSFSSRLIGVTKTKIKIFERISKRNKKIKNPYLTFIGRINSEETTYISGYYLLKEDE